MIRVCLDTVITSDRVLKDLDRPEERLAVEQIEALHEQGLIKRVTTPVSREEERRTSNAQKRAALEAGWDDVSVVQPEPRLLGFQSTDMGSRGFIASPLMSDIDEDLLARLLNVGLKRNDARAVVFAVGTNCDYFVTHDTKDLLPHRVAIEAIFPTIRIVKPTEFLAAWRATSAV
jgi:hypothetical protein